MLRRSLVLSLLCSVTLLASLLPEAVRADFYDLQEGGLKYGPATRSTMEHTAQRQHSDGQRVRRADTSVGHKQILCIACVTPPH